MMRARQYIFSFLIVSLLLQGRWLSAQEYLDLWRNSKTDNFYLVQQKFNEYFAGRDSGRGTGYKQFKRWEAFMEPRVYPSGKLINPTGLALDEELRYQGRLGSARLKNVPTGNWQSLGIKTYKHTTGSGGGLGRVNCITPHPTDPQTLFIGTPAGGIWKTTDGGSNWTPLSDGIPVIGVSAIAVNPVYPDSIYILTGDCDALYTNSIGVLLSINGGDTWQSTGLQWENSKKVRGFKLLMHPTNRKILFAATNQGIYKTTDGGVTWGPPKIVDAFCDLVFKPGNPSILYATAFDSYSRRSVDGGENWEIWGAQFPGRTAIGVTPANPEYIYIVCGSNEKYYGIIRSTNGGGTWRKQSDDPNILGTAIKDPFKAVTQATYDLAIAVSPTNADVVHVGGINCWKSLDGGITWKYTSDLDENNAPAGMYTHADIHALVFSGNTLYCGSDGGVYFSNDRAATWKDMSYGLEITQFYRISAPLDDLGVVYGGTQDVGLNKWTALNPTTMDNQLGGDVMECVVDYTNRDIAYALNENGTRLIFTQNGGTNWLYSGKLPTQIKGAWVTPLIMHPTDHTTLYAGYNVILKIIGGGTSPVLSPVSPDWNASVVALGMSAANTSYMYAAMPTKLMKSTDLAGTHSWIDITKTLPVSEAQITDVGVSALDPEKVWVSFSGYVSAKNKMYQTVDGGATWTNISGSLPNVPVNCILYHNNGQDGVYIGTDIGVFYRDNTMTDWMPFRNGMPNVIIMDLKITDNKIRAATFGRGIWESDLYGSCAATYTLTGDVNGYQFFEASDAITSAANIKGGIGTKVQYRAVNKITLNTGFTVVPQSGFVASLGNCTGTQASKRKYRGIYEGVMPGAWLKVDPNPVPGQSMIAFYLAKPTAVTVSLQDLSGKRIKVLLKSSSLLPGNHQVKLNAAGLSSGEYLVRLQTQDYEETKTIIIKR